MVMININRSILLIHFTQIEMRTKAAVIAMSILINISAGDCSQMQWVVDSSKARNAMVRREARGRAREAVRRERAIQSEEEETKVSATAI
jgi:hypothetical protein